MERMSATARMTKMVNYNEPEPKFDNPADINSKSEPVVIHDTKSEEIDELAERIKAMNTGKVFDADTPKNTPDKTVFEPTPKIEDTPWYKKAHQERLAEQPVYQGIKREPPLIERRKQFTLNANKRSMGEVDRIIRSGKFHTVGGESKVDLSNIYIYEFVEEPVDKKGGRK